MVVTESRNTSLESLSCGFPRAPFQALTGSARGKARGQAVARTPAPRGTASAADLREGGRWLHTAVAESALLAYFGRNSSVPSERAVKCR